MVSSRTYCLRLWQAESLASCDFHSLLGSSSNCFMVLTGCQYYLPWHLRYLALWQYFASSGTFSDLCFHLHLMETILRQRHLARPPSQVHRHRFPFYTWRLTRWYLSYPKSPCDPWLRNLRGDWWVLTSQLADQVSCASPQVRHIHLPPSYPLQASTWLLSQSRRPTRWEAFHSCWSLNDQAPSKSTAYSLFPSLLPW